MLKLRDLVPNLFKSLLGDRRQENYPVSDERRKPRNKLRGLSQADARLTESMDRLDRTVRLHRDDFFSREVANDIQTVTVFRTFAEICTYRSTQGSYRICKHPKHEAAGTGVATCNEEQCPFARGKTITEAA